MSSISVPDIRKEFVKSKVGLVGIGILACLIILSAVSAITIPIDTFKQWNNPGSWISYPKTSMPVWINYFVTEKISHDINQASYPKEPYVSFLDHIMVSEPLLKNIDSNYDVQTLQMGKCGVWVWRLPQ